MKNSVKPKIVFWTEGGRSLGMGHLCRSLVIAREFLAFGWASLFVINNNLVVKDRLRSQGFPFMPGELDAKEPPPSVGEVPTTFIFDSKKDISTLIKMLKTSGHKVILIDNTTPARLAADVVIYPSAFFDNDLNWPGFTGRVYGGSQYAPVDETYLNAREKCRVLNHQPPYRILVSMGGSDPMQLTNQIVSSLRCLSQPIDIKVVIGPSFTLDPRLDVLEQENEPALTFIRGKNTLSSLMADSHMAITAVGTTLYELAAVGVPGIVIANYIEDHRDMEQYKKLGMNLPLGFYKDITFFHIQEAVSKLIQDSAIWQNMRNKGWRLIDGHGARRIVECILTNI